MYFQVSATCFPIWNLSTKISMLIPNCRYKKRFRHVRESQKGRPDRRDPDQSQSALRTGDPSNVGTGVEALVVADVQPIVGPSATTWSGEPSSQAITRQGYWHQTPRRS